MSVTVEFEGDEAKVAAHLERDLKLFKAFAETRGSSGSRETPQVASPSPPTGRAA